MSTWYEVKKWDDDAITEVGVVQQQGNRLRLSNGRWRDAVTDYSTIVESTAEARGLIKRRLEMSIIAARTRIAEAEERLANIDKIRIEKPSRR